MLFMAKRKRLRKVGNKPLKVFISGKNVGEVRTAKEFDQILKGVDRNKQKVRLV